MDKVGLINSLVPSNFGCFIMPLIPSPHFHVSALSFISSSSFSSSASSSSFYSSPSLCPFPVCFSFCIMNQAMWTINIELKVPSAPAVYQFYDFFFSYLLFPFIFPVLINYLTSLGLSFSIWKMETIMDCYKHQMNEVKLLAQCLTQRLQDTVNFALV